MMKQLRTMIIDDSKVQLKLTTKLVEAHSRLVLCATSTSTHGVAETVRSENIELLLLDVEMPEMNGFELLDTLDHPCLIIMNSTRPSFAMYARQCGVDAFLTKPIDKVHFKESIDSLLAQPWIAKNDEVFHCTRYEVTKQQKPER